jgi:hypothetical protein
MRDSDKRAKLKKPEMHGGSGAQGAALDPQSQKLAKIAGTVGNEAVRAHFAGSNASRDKMLEFLTHRLATIHEVQQREIQACGYTEMRENWKEMADSQRDDVKLPDPTKWAESALLYERAAFKLCNGELGVGSQLMRNAMDAEQRAFEQVSSTLDLREVEEASEGSGVVADVGSGDCSQPCDLPDGVALADKIQAVSTTVKDVPDNPRVPIPWWTEFEEEEEGDGDESGS